MRGIKYRAWDKQKKQMVYGIEETYDGLPYSELNEKVELDIYNHMCCFSSWLCGDYEVMQYTGLKDKNGIEIYEGDVVRWHDVVTWDYSVTFKDGVFCIADDSSSNFYHLKEDIKGKFEIIGNIYEYPELLEESAK